MHHRKGDDAHIWMDAEGRELVSRLNPRRPTCDEINQANCYARRVRSRQFRRALRRWLRLFWK